MPENRTALMQYRYAAAKERGDSAQILFDAGNYKDSIGRSYYAMFSAVRALLAVEGKDFPSAARLRWVKILDFKGF